MVRKDANQSRSDVEKYRKQLGNQIAFISFVMGKKMCNFSFSFNLF